MLNRTFDRYWFGIAIWLGVQVSWYLKGRFTRPQDYLAALFTLALVILGEWIYNKWKDKHGK